MREIRIYQPGEYAVGQQIELSSEASQHVAVVLRMQPGQLITLFSGDNHEYASTIVSAKKKQTLVLIDSIKAINRESSLKIHLAQGISKGERMELVMQKSVELGVASITPLITQHCAVKLDKERMAKKLNQWRAIIIAACEQSGRNTIPQLNDPVTLSHYLQNMPAGLRFILEPDAGKNWRDYEFGHKDVSLMIGPEGGLSADEVQLACQNGFQPLSLGPRILRTETAALTAISLLQAVGGDL